MVRNRQRILEVARIKREIIAEIVYDVADGEMTQKELCASTGLKQSEASAILNSKNLERFTVDRLLMVLIALGHKPSVYVC